MEAEERPRKLAKIGHDQGTIQDAAGPVNTMTSAEPVQTDTAAHPDLNPEPSEHPSTETEIKTTEPASATNEATEDGAPKMSKNQLKKLRRREKWEEQRGLRKERRKERIGEKRERRGKLIDEAREKGGEEAVEALRKTWESTRSRKMRSTLLPLAIIIDCSYDDLMNPKERVSLASQMTRSYSQNTRAPWRSNLMFSSFDKLLKERFDTVLAPHKNWKGIEIIQEDFVHAAELAKQRMITPRGGQLVGPFAGMKDAKPEDGEVIYLSSDSDNVLTELKPYDTYIIGGLVDKNRYKAVCYKKAVEKGIKTARLPIGDYIQMSSRSVMTTNHVVDIMLNWLELGDWGEAFMKVMPPRKGGKLRSQSTEEGEGEEEEEADEGNIEEEADDIAEIEKLAAEEEGNEDEH
ncbi:tRNA (guanine(9)-N1)-methyltransferase [Penicillium taxi]|uniref:tRNA (guanine(9)-N1)-methyltransferase n=1 Tax=Penicillium taxi TaxID=168475 RepID=UPI002545AAD3|nr:tRNA (guanine(9)-N1)-methyltransferase [Penicillium taxi]KAJ5884947.1 tRNA (guanine(9)-N1)-methyltransferase [Penicillium taxi]